MTINFSFRNEKGQFLKHSLVMNTLTTKVLGTIALIALEKTASSLLDIAVKYYQDKQAEKEQIELPDIQIQEVKKA